jgi:gephyrin
MAGNSLRIGVLTVSDRCSRGETVDQSGPKIVEFLGAKLGQKAGQPPIFLQALVPDDVPAIQREVMRFVDVEKCALVVTTGGTGFTPRDMTPEAVRPLLTKEAPGLAHAMMAYGLTQTPHAWLSRSIAGVRGQCIVITVPGSPGAAVECLTPLANSGLHHALELAGGNAGSAHPAAGASSASSPVPRGVASTERDVTARDRMSNYPMVSMDDALRLIATQTPQPREITVAVSSSAGLVTASGVVSTFAHPPFRASVKDGYAVIASDGPGEYAIAGSLCAGATVRDDFILQSNTAVRVNTGGPIPDGADAVVQVEDTELIGTKEMPEGREEARILVKVAVKPGYDIRPIGCDLSVNGTAVPRDTLMGPAEIGLALSVGATSVTVYGKPRIAVLSTGDELAPITAGSAAPPHGKIYDSNRGMLMAAVAEHASSVVDCGIAKDTMKDTREKLERAFASADVIISTGGVSMGEVDCVKACLLDMGATIHFGRVNMKPGKPTTFATLHGKVFFALPGNPVSAMVCFYVFVSPALRKLRGLPRHHLPVVTASLTHDVKLDHERPEYHRCRVVFDAAASKMLATSTGIQASHRLLSLAGANGLMVLPIGKANLAVLPAHSQVDVMLIGPIEN